MKRVDLSRMEVLDRNRAAEFCMTPWTLIPEGSQYRVLQQVVITMLSIFVAFKTLCIPHVFSAVWIVRNCSSRKVELKKLQGEFSEGIQNVQEMCDKTLTMARGLGDVPELVVTLSFYQKKLEKLSLNTTGDFSVFLLSPDFPEFTYLKYVPISIPACFDPFMMETTTSNISEIAVMEADLYRISKAINKAEERIKDKVEAKQESATALGKELDSDILDLQNKIVMAGDLTGLLEALKLLQQKRGKCESEVGACFLLDLQDVENRLKELRKIFNGQLSARAFFPRKASKAGNQCIRIDAFAGTLQEYPTQLLIGYANKVSNALCDGADFSELSLKVVLDNKVVRDQDVTNGEFLHLLFGALKLKQGLFHKDCSLKVRDMENLGYVMRHIYENDNLLLERDLIREHDFRLLLSYSQKELQEFREAALSINDALALDKPIAIDMQRFFVSMANIMPRILNDLSSQKTSEKWTQNIFQMHFLGICAEPTAHNYEIMELDKSSPFYREDLSIGTENHREMVVRCIWSNLSELAKYVDKMERFSEAFNELDHSQRELLNRNDGINWGSIMQDTLYARGWEHVSKRILKEELPVALATKDD